MTQWIKQITSVLGILFPGRCEGRAELRVTKLRLSKVIALRSNLVYVPGNSVQVHPPPCHPTHEHCKYHYSSFFSPLSPPTHCTLWQILWQGINSPPQSPVSPGLYARHMSFVSVGCCSGWCSLLIQTIWRRCNDRPVGPGQWQPPLYKPSANYSYVSPLHCPRPSHYQQTSLLETVF